MVFSVSASIYIGHYTTFWPHIPIRYSYGFSQLYRWIQMFDVAVVVGGKDFYLLCLIIVISYGWILYSSIYLISSSVAVQLSLAKGHSNKNLVNQLGIAGGGQDFFSPVWGGGQAFFCCCWGGVRHFLLTFYLFELYILYTFSNIYTLTLWVMEDSILEKFTRFARISL